MDEDGKHLILDIYTDEPILNNNKEMCALLEKSIELSGNIKIQTIKHEFKPYGLTCIALLMESHMSIHTYPERKYVAIDIYTCGNGNPIKALNYIEEKLNPTHIKTVLVERGSETIIYMLGKQYRQEDSFIIKERLTNVMVAYEKELCIHCMNPLGSAKFDGVGNEQPYCFKCDKWSPNEDYDVLMKMFNILEADTLRTYLENVLYELKECSENGLDFDQEKYESTKKSFAVIVNELDNIITNVKQHEKVEKN